MWSRSTYGQFSTGLGIKTVLPALFCPTELSGVSQLHHSLLSNLPKYGAQMGMIVPSLQHVIPSGNKPSTRIILIQIDSLRRIIDNKCNCSRLQSVSVGHMSARNKIGHSQPYNCTLSFSLFEFWEPTWHHVGHQEVDRESEAAESHNLRPLGYACDSVGNHSTEKGAVSFPVWYSPLSNICFGYNHNRMVIPIRCPSALNNGDVQSILRACLYDKWTLTNRPSILQQQLGWHQFYDHDSPSTITFPPQLLYVRASRLDRRLESTSNPLLVFSQGTLHRPLLSM